MKIKLNAKRAISTLFSFISAAVIFFTFPGCSKDNMTTPTSLAVSSKDVTGIWSVTQFLERGDDETNDFSGITVEFSDSGDFIVNENNAVAFTGSWQIINDDGVTKLKIVLNTNQKPFKDFDDDWILIGKTDDKLGLLDDNEASNESMMLERI